MIKFQEGNFTPSHSQIPWCNFPPPQNSQIWAVFVPLKVFNFREVILPSNYQISGAILPRNVSNFREVILLLKVSNFREVSLHLKFSNFREVILPLNVFNFREEILPSNSQISGGDFTPQTLKVVVVVLPLKFWNFRGGN